MNQNDYENRTANWWYCDNLIAHHDFVGLLSLNFPRVFILFRNQKDFVLDSFEEWKQGVAEINFLDPSDRKNADIDSILTDAWNFMALQEAKDEELYNDYKDDENE